MESALLKWKIIVRANLTEPNIKELSFGSFFFGLILVKKVFLIR